MSVQGTVITGLGRGAAFTALDWARSQFIARLGVDPHPGTLNLPVVATAAAAWFSSLPPAERILPPDAAQCAADAWAGADRIVPSIAGLPRLLGSPAAGKD
jgi:hypothetical protein